jgi:Uma2 family endonuclease
MRLAILANRKKAADERFGFPSYWIVDPDPPQPELTAPGSASRRSSAA